MDISTGIKSFLNEIALENNFQSFEVELKDGSEKGNGFLSDITRAKIVGQRNNEKGELNSDQLNLVCKLSFPEKSQREQFKTDRYFEREAYFYNEIAPAFMDFQRARGLSETDMFKAFPKCYKAIYDPAKELFVIIMDDIKSEGFQLWHKERVAKIENTCLIVRELAKLHAISFAMRDQYPEKFEKFDNLVDLWPTFLEPGAICNIAHQNYRRVIQMLDKPEHKKIYETYLKDTRKYYVACTDNSIPKKFRVINHGDSWMNNILLKLDENDVANETTFLDWQVLRCASPALDLHYHIFTSTDKQLRDAHYDELNRMYYEQLSTNIRKLGSDPDQLFTYADFLDGLKICGNFAYLHTPHMILLSIASDDLDDIKNFTNETETSAYKGLSEASQEEFKKRLTDILDDLDKLDYFKELTD